MSEWIKYRTPVRVVPRTDPTSQPTGRYLQGSDLRELSGTGGAHWGLVYTANLARMSRALIVSQRISADMSYL